MIEWLTISKLLPHLIYPFNLILFFLGVGCLLVVVRQLRVGLRLFYLAFAIALVSGSPLSSELYRRHEYQNLPVELGQLPTVDAIVLLGGDVGLPLYPRVDSEIMGNRTLHTFRLYKAGKAKLILISGGNVFPQTNVYGESYYSAALLSEWGIPNDVIVVEPNSRNTYENAVETKKLLESLQVDKILLVTSAFHMPRALATFRTVGIDAIPAPSSYLIVNVSKPAIFEWIPSLSNLGKMQRVIHEKLGILVYRNRGWIS
jgi:uncharacterized SAM-binding protein YcdF (DUF218 family)